MSQPTQSAARTPLPYAKYVHILLTGGTAFWILAGYYIWRSTHGAKFMPEELGAFAVAVTATLAAAVVWGVDRLAPGGTKAAPTTFAVTRHGVYESANREDIRYGVRSAPSTVARVRSRNIEDDTVQMGRTPSGSGLATAVADRVVVRGDDAYWRASADIFETLLASGDDDQPLP